MARSTSDPKVSQAAPTAARPVSADGRTLDPWGLPIGGPARQRALEGRPDPLDDPSAWPGPSPTAPNPAATANQED